MRMRKLGKGQSVTFCVSLEMQARIRRVRNLPDAQALLVPHILFWAISETWDEATRSVPLWATQGIRHQRQEVIWGRTTTEDGGPVFADGDVRAYLEGEAQTLEQRYRPSPTAGGNCTTLVGEAMGDPALESRREHVERIRDRCRDLGISDLDSAALQEEQERELAPEKEQERQVERPPPKEALKHNVHPEVGEFVRSGRLAAESRVIVSAWRAMSKTSAAALMPAPSFPCDILVTGDFRRTVEEGDDYCADAYQRAVQWILTARSKVAKHAMYMVAISPWEANSLLLELSKSKHTVLHIYLPRPSRTFRCLDDLRALSVPPVDPVEWSAPTPLTMQLNLFAGQLCLRSYGEYTEICRWLGLSCRENDGQTKVGPDGFVGRQAGEECPFETSPVAFLSVVFKKIRRDCDDISGSHMGRILSAEILHERNFE